MKFLSRIALAAVLVAFSAQTVEAQAGQYGATEWFRFDHTVSGGSTGPYIADWLASQTGPTNAQVTIYCVDYHHAIRGGDVWKANVTSLSSTSIGNTRLGYSGVTDAYERYAQVSYLSSLMETNTSDWTAIHKAIWRITSQQGYSGGGTNTLSLDYQQQAQDWASDTNFDINQWAVLTDVRAQGDEYGVQEYVTRVPEPSTILLLGTGILLLVGVSRRRIMEIADAA